MVKTHRGKVKRLLSVVLLFGLILLGVISCVFVLASGKIIRALTVQFSSMKPYALHGGWYFLGGLTFLWLCFWMASSSRFSKSTPGAQPEDITLRSYLLASALTFSTQMTVIVGIALMPFFSPNPIGALLGFSGLYFGVAVCMLFLGLIMKVGIRVSFSIGGIHTVLAIACFMKALGIAAHV